MLQIFLYILTSDIYVLFHGLFINVVISLSWSADRHLFGFKQAGHSLRQAGLEEVKLKLFEVVLVIY